MYRYQELLPMEYMVRRTYQKLHPMYEVNPNIKNLSLKTGDLISDHDAMALMKEPAAIIDYNSPLLEMLCRD